MFTLKKQQVTPFEIRYPIKGNESDNKGVFI